MFFGIDAPLINPTPVENLAFNAYAYRQTQLDQVAERLARHRDWTDFALQCAVYDDVGIDSDTFSEAEKEYIVNKILRLKGEL